MSDHKYSVNIRLGSDGMWPFDKKSAENFVKEAIMFRVDQLGHMEGTPCVFNVPWADAYKADRLAREIADVHAIVQADPDEEIIPWDDEHKELGSALLRITERRTYGFITDEEFMNFVMDFCSVDAKSIGRKTICDIVRENRSAFDALSLEGMTAMKPLYEHMRMQGKPAKLTS